MTKAKVKISGKEYTFEGDSAEDAISKIKYSRVPFKMVRAIGIKWTRKILWPTLRNLNDRYDGEKGVTLTLPKTIRSLLKEKTEGDLTASLDMKLQSDNFLASAKGTFSSDGLDLSFESEIDEADRTGSALRESLNFISDYNIDVDQITFEIDKSNADPTALIDIDATVPRDLSRKHHGIS